LGFAFDDEKSQNLVLTKPFLSFVAQLQGDKLPDGKQEG
jgi:hypothetical protein